MWVSKLDRTFESVPCCYDSCDAAVLALELSDEDKQTLQRAADARAGRAGAITCRDVVEALAARQSGTRAGQCG